MFLSIVKMDFYGKLLFIKVCVIYFLWVYGKLNYMVKWAEPEASKRITLVYDFNTNKIGVWKDGIFIREI